METNILFRCINLQMFADGGAASGGDGGTGANGTATAEGTLATSGNGAATEASTSQADSVENPAEDRNLKFEALIKGEYKDLYDARVQDTIQKRLKGSKEIVDKYNSLTPTLETLAKKYGLTDVNDIDALNRAIEEDDSYYEDEALEKGITVEQLKQIRKMERENADLKRQMREQQTRERADQIYAKWMDDSKALKGIYPSFNLEAEMQNARFVDLLKNNVDVRTAYEVLHKDEIIPAAMQFTAKQVEQKLTNKIMANGSRPTENGVSGNASAIVKVDVSQTTKAQREEYIRRALNGERITFK